MGVRYGDVGVAIATFLVLVALPLSVIWFLPPDYVQQFSSAGLDIPSVLYQTAALGVVISVVTLAKAFIDKASIKYLLLGIASEVISLAFALLVVGAGNIGNLGYSNIRIAQGKLTTVIALDLRVFVWLTIVVVGLSVLQTIMKFREAKAEKTAPG